MYKELVGCGSVITYVRKDFEQDCLIYLALRYYQTF
jgi:hypothetical protein